VKTNGGCDSHRWRATPVTRADVRPRDLFDDIAGPQILAQSVTATDTEQPAMESVGHPAGRPTPPLSQRRPQGAGL